MSETSTAPMIPEPKSRLVYVLLALLLGPFGIHNFYAGYIGRALAQLAITLFLGWLVLPALFVYIWVIAEIFFVTRDADRHPFAGSGCAVIIGLIAVITISILAAILWHDYLDGTLPEWLSTAKNAVTPSRP